MPTSELRPKSSHSERSPVLCCRTCIGLDDDCIIKKIRVILKQGLFYGQGRLKIELQLRYILCENFTSGLIRTLSIASFRYWWMFKSTPINSNVTQIHVFMGRNMRLFCEILTYKSRSTCKKRGSSNRKLIDYAAIKNT